MSNLQLIEPSIIYKERYIDYVQEWEGTKMVPNAAIMKDITYEEWLKQKEDAKSIHTCRPGYMPATFYLLMNEERIIGCVSIRHQLNERMLAVGGHIGYGIRPSERGKGYAKQMLLLALKITVQMGINPALLTVDDDNPRSIKTIESCGGVLENKVFDVDHYVLRYWIYSNY